MKFLLLVLAVVLVGQSVLAADKKPLTKEVDSLHLSVELLFARKIDLEIGPTRFVNCPSNSNPWD